jgi:putative transposase
MLTERIDDLRQSVARAQTERPFTIDASVAPPDHRQAIWTLPAGDTDHSVRWGAIKARFSMAARRAGFSPPPPVGRGNGGLNPAL